MAGAHPCGQGAAAADQPAQGRQRQHHLLHLGHDGPPQGRHRHPPAVRVHLRGRPAAARDGRGGDLRPRGRVLELPAVRPHLRAHHVQRPALLRRAAGLLPRRHPQAHGGRAAPQAHPLRQRPSAVLAHLRQDPGQDQQQRRRGQGPLLHGHERQARQPPQQRRRQTRHVGLDHLQQDQPPPRRPRARHGHRLGPHIAPGARVPQVRLQRPHLRGIRHDRDVRGVDPEPPGRHDGRAHRRVLPVHRGQAGVAARDGLHHQRQAARRHQVPQGGALPAGAVRLPWLLQAA
mmetsp:Transcript_25753/g.63868  ORF Transcript_25753/g.63868 Transcript_25753/m.63868 type:complete len:289 (+) Transcript_25753:740-1606(+)